MRDLVFGQAKINKCLNKKLVANDKILEGINAKDETLSSALKNQLSFNKMIETQFAQIAAAVPFSEKVNVVTMRGGKSTRDPPHPNHAEKAARPQAEEEESPNMMTLKIPRKKIHRNLLIQASSRLPPRNKRPPWTSSSLVSLR